MVVRMFFIMIFMYESLFSMRPTCQLYQLQKQIYLDESLRNCILNPNTPIDRVKYLLASGANPEQDCRLMYESTGITITANLHKFGFNEMGCSPNPWRNQYEGNKEVMDYIFAVLLEKKLQRAIDTEKKMYAALPHDELGISFVSRYWQYRQ